MHVAGNDYVLAAQKSPLDSRYRFGSAVPCTLEAFAIFCISNIVHWRRILVRHKLVKHQSSPVRRRCTCWLLACKSWDSGHSVPCFRRLAG